MFTGLINAFHPSSTLRYVEVHAGQLCCVDPNLTESRVEVGFGDSCCGHVPYDSQGAQLCCNGMTGRLYIILRECTECDYVRLDRVKLL